MSPLGTSGQASFAGGVHRRRRAAADAAYDLVNVLLDDDGLPFRRGGSAYVTTSNASEQPFSLKSSYFPGPQAQRTLTFGASGVHIVTGSSFLPFDSAEHIQAPIGCRPVAAGQYVCWPSKASDYWVLKLVLYAGALKSYYDAGTVSASNSSTAATIDGVGTAWLANVDAGMMFTIAGEESKQPFIVTQVNSNTSITLDRPWSGGTRTGQGYFLEQYRYRNSFFPQIFSAKFTDAATPYLAYAGRRLLFAYGTRVAFSPIDLPYEQAVTDYHDLPGDAFITGADGIEDTALVFTTEGVWAISNLLFDPVDDAGNVQQIVQQVNKDIMLWGDAGISAYAGGLVVPAVDDVFLMAPDGAASVVSAAIRSLYRSYVKAGYQPGQAAVHRGHYFLPVMNGATVVDVLVCRLDQAARPWVRWSGNAAAAGFATQIGASTRSPRLLGVSGLRAVDLSDCFSPSAGNALDADGTAHTVTVETRDYPTSGSNHPGTVARARLRYELTDDGSGATAAPTVALAYSSDQDAGAWTTLTAPGLEASASAGGDVSDGSAYSHWQVGKKRERIRFRITQTGAAASFVVRALEMLIRQSGLR